MKTMTCAVLLLFLIVSSPIYAQGRPDSASTGQGRKARLSQKFIDVNGDGIDDRSVGTSPGDHKGKDRFVDEDGDGICDSRATGLGFRRHGAGTGLMMGADGKGKMRRLGSGGKP